MISYSCNRCLGEFQAVNRVKKVVRCPLCGGLEVSVTGSRTHVVREEQTDTGRRRVVFEPRPAAPTMTGRFACVNCALEFEHEGTEEVLRKHVRCTRCGSTELVPISPRARALIRAKPLTGAEGKRVQFVRRNWSLRCELEQWCRTFVNLVHRVGLSDARVKHYETLLLGALEEVDTLHESRLHEYEGMRA